MLGWKDLPETNTLTNYDHLQITAVKSFITLGPGVHVRGHTLVQP